MTAAPSRSHTANSLASWLPLCGMLLDLPSHAAPGPPKTSPQGLTPSVAIRQAPPRKRPTVAPVQPAALVPPATAPRPGPLVPPPIPTLALQAEQRVFARLRAPRAHHKKQPLLSAHVPALLAAAPEHPRLVRALAAIYLAEKNSDAALHWLGRLWNQHPTDALWLADYVWALSEAGRLAAARRIARHALHRIEPRALSWAERLSSQTLSRSQTQLGLEHLRTYVRLLRVVRLDDAGPRMVRLLARCKPTALRRTLTALYRSSANPLAGAGFAKTRGLRLQDPWQLVAAAAESQATAPALDDEAPAPPSLKHDDKGEEEDGDDDDEEEDDEEEDDEEEDDEEDAEKGDDDADNESDDDSEDGAAAERPRNRKSTASSSDDLDEEDGTTEDESDEPISLARWSAVVGGEVFHLGGVTLGGATARGDLALGRFGLGLRTAYLYASHTHAWLNLDDIGLRTGEADVAVTGRVRLPHEYGRMELTLGGNLREQGSLVYGIGHAEFAPPLGIGSNLLLELNLGFNQIVTDTTELRLLGARDRVQVGIDFDLTAREFINLFADWHRYLARDRFLLSNGFSMYGEIGHRLLLANPGLNVRLTGYIERNTFADKLPLAIARLGASDDRIAFDDVIYDGFAMVGLAATVRRGIPGTGVSDARRLRGFMDVWLGYLWPLNDFGFDVQTGIGYVLPRLGEISLSGYVSNSRMGGGQEGVSFGGSLRWAY